MVGIADLHRADVKPVVAAAYAALHLPCPQGVVNGACSGIIQDDRADITDVVIAVNIVCYAAGFDLVVYFVGGSVAQNNGGGIYAVSVSGSGGGNCAVGMDGV